MGSFINTGRRLLAVLPWLGAACLGMAASAWAGDLAPPPPAPGVIGFAEALSQALQRDGELRSAMAAVQAARAQEAQLRSRFLPSAGVQVQQGRRSVDELTTPVNRHVRSTEGFVRWNVYNGGADKTQLDAAVLEVTAAEAEARQSLEDACERLGKAYIELQKQQALHAAAQRRLAELEDLAGRVARQVAAGKAAEADGELAQSSLIDARLAVQGSAADLLAAQAQLSVLTGLTGLTGLTAPSAPQPPVLLAAATPPLEVPWPTRAPALALQAPLDDWWTLAMQAHAGHQAATARREAARARVPLIAPEYLPRADLELRKTLSQRTAPEETTRERRGWTLSINYEVPLGGGATARREEARARAESAESQAWRSEQALRGELAVVRQQGLQAADALPAIARQREHLDAVVRASDLQYQAGRRSLLQLIDQRDRRFNADQREVEAAWRLRQALLRLAVLTGSLASGLGVGGAP